MKIRLLPCLFLTFVAWAQDKKAITLDEYFNTTFITGARLSPDGSAAVIELTAPDWQGSRFRKDLWLWTVATKTLVPLTHSGHEGSAVFSPDGRYLAFLSDRALSQSDRVKADPPDKDEPARVWLLRLAGGEAFPLYREPLDAHAFAWAADSSAVLLSAKQEIARDEEEARKAEWKDVVRWREQERGDAILELPIAGAVRHAAATPLPHEEVKSDASKPAYPEGARVVTTSALEISELAASPHGDLVAFETTPISHRLEDPAASEIFVAPVAGGSARQLTKNAGLESQLAWTPTGAAIDFVVGAAAGSIEGPYQDVQGRLYSLDVASGKVTRLGGKFTGSWSDFAVMPDGAVMATGITGLSRGMYRVEGDGFKAISTLPGTFERPVAALHGGALLFLRSTINQPTQAYLAASPAGIDQAQPLTAINQIFLSRAQPTWKPFQWKSSDGTAVEGVLIYPPGKDGAKGLRMLTLIHGGPADADGNHFGADWYDWATLAAARGWLVFRPNYRGSSGYGDEFQLGIMPHLVSVPGKDILSGVDALVAAGIADPAHLAIGGYSYGGYMTNWLITQTTRFKSAVTGAGAVEHAANWGNDDLTFDDGWYLSGAPWQRPELYQSEAALFQLDKVKTPTHIVGGDADNRVSFLEDVLLERGLQALKVPHELLVFPGENHPLDKNPWHGYVKVREELKWLERWDGN